MECFEHEGIQAVGLCKSCYRAVCKDCAIIIPHGVACSQECEKDVQETNEILERSKKIYGIGDYKSNKLASGVWVWLLLSIAFWGIALFPVLNGQPLSYGKLLMPIIFSVITLIVYNSSKNTGINC